MKTTPMSQHIRDLLNGIKNRKAHLQMVDENNTNEGGQLPSDLFLRLEPKILELEKELAYTRFA